MDTSGFPTSRLGYHIRSLTELADLGFSVTRWLSNPRSHWLWARQLMEHQTRELRRSFRATPFTDYVWSIPFVRAPNDHQFVDGLALFRALRSHLARAWLWIVRRFGGAYESALTWFAH